MPKLRSVELDICSRSLTLSLNVWVGSLAADTDEEREKYKEALVTMHALTHCILDEQTVEPSNMGSGTLEIDGVPTSVATLPSLPGLLRAGDGTFPNPPQPQSRPLIAPRFGCPTLASFSRGWAAMTVASL